MQDKNTMLALLLGLATTVMTPAVSAGEAYAMICNGGGAMRGTYEIHPDTTRVFRFYFKKAAQGGGARKPGSGECAWVDRPLNSHEPAVLEWRVKADRRAAFYLDITDGKVSKVGYGEDTSAKLAASISRSGLFYVRATLDAGKKKLNIT
ncbi:MAG: hypothetical protein OEY07_15495, partial [Gammaproteobacteria bacterium]|nr:hypothetical protein [Gammaproteobacteria bacterium]